MPKVVSSYEVRSNAIASVVDTLLVQIPPQDRGLLKEWVELSLLETEIAFPKKVALQVRYGARVGRIKELVSRYNLFEHGDIIRELCKRLEIPFTEEV